MKRSGLPRYVTGFRDRHGKMRWRARRHARVTHYFTAEPGSEPFLLEYQRWLAGGPAVSTGERRTVPYSVSALIVRLYRSAEWAGLAQSTKATYRGILERFRAAHGDKPWAQIERKHVREMIAKRSGTPAAANNLLRILRMLARFAIVEEWRPDDPTLGVKPVKVKTGGFHTWSDSETATFEQHWPIGSRARLAFALLLHTGQRRSDVIRMGRQHIRDGRIRVVQQKTGADLSIPIHSDLQAVLDAHPGDNLTFLVTALGSPFSPAGFGNWFRGCCDAAGLKLCSAHGLRKAAATRLAEAGCSANEIMSITGHKTLKEVSGYTRAADQKRLADAAMQRIDRERKVANPENRLAKTGAKALKSGA